MERITRFRAGLVMAFFCVIVLFFAFKLYDLQIVATDGNVDNTKTFTTITHVKAARGDILDRNGNKLITNRASYDLTINHYVILSANGTNNHLLSLVELCREVEIEYNDHFPVSTTAPFTYTLDELNSTWQGYFQDFLPEKGDLDSDITAPLLMKKLRVAYKIPEEWSDADARAVIGLRYELDLRQGITNLPNFVFIEDADADDLSAILELNVPGLNTESSTVREYNTKYAAHILGYCAPMSKDQWEYYKKLTDENGNALYTMDALVGQSGLEAAFEEYLHGVDGVRVDVVRADGTIVKQYYKEGQEPKAGQNVELTIDLNLQMAAENGLHDLITSLRGTLMDGLPIPGYDVEGAAVVAMDIKTGQVLTCASYPTYDLSSVLENWNTILEEEYAPLFNRALQAEYPPGSTYKVAMVVAGIDSQTITPLTRIRDEGVFDKYAPFTANCMSWTHGEELHGNLDAVGALKVSCNYFFYELADRMTIQEIDDTAKGLGLGESTGIELPERIGHRANPETKKLLHEEDQQGWYPADQVMVGIGQSDNRFTPMQLCSYTCALANQGVRYKATFLNRVLSSDYRSETLKNKATILNTLPISDTAYDIYLEGMIGVASEGSVGYLFNGYPYTVAAKTGTAQHATDSSDHGAFICFAPAEDPQIAIAVYGEKIGGGPVSARIAKVILDTYFNLDNGNGLPTLENKLG